VPGLWRVSGIHLLSGLQIAPFQESEGMSIVAKVWTWEDCVALAQGHPSPEMGPHQVPG
jgi:hypothetical protein